MKESITCPFTDTINGLPCKGAVPKGKQYCNVHDPEIGNTCEAYVMKHKRGCRNKKQEGHRFCGPHLYWEGPTV